ncbi:MAG: hypothetical protein ABI729_08340 [Chitinophagales bacterium]
MKKQILIVTMVLAAFGFSANAQTKTVLEVDNSPGWHKIVETTADLKTDFDEVAVIGADHYKAIKLKVTDSDLELMDIRIMYENETTQDIEVRKMIKQGESTREVDLTGKDRAIKKIRISYKTVPNADHDKAHLEIWGLK